MCPLDISSYPHFQLFNHIFLLGFLFPIQIVSWTIGKIPKDKSPCLSGTMQLEKGLEHLQEFPTLLVAFKIMGVAMSGLKIDKTEVRNVSYNPYKGFRAVSRAASYEIRT